MPQLYVVCGLNMAKGPVVRHSLERGEITASRAGGKPGNGRIAKQGIGMAGRCILMVVAELIADWPSNALW
ncbi:hypothetical protein CF137_21775 [Aeromonas sobria]|nr:hypothetical protein CF137_21775 [Aeromonas sobria]